MDNELKHFGILGQKWGIRRYQNPDGTLTEEGKIHYGKSGNAREGMYTKRVKDMSDDELKNAINRLTLEKNYKDKMAELYPEKVTLADKIINKLKNETIPNTINDVIKNTTTNFVDKYAGAKLDEFINNKFESKKLKQEAENASNRLTTVNKNQLADLMKDKYILPFNEKSDKPISYTKDGEKWLNKQNGVKPTTKIDLDRKISNMTDSELSKVFDRMKSEMDYSRRLSEYSSFFNPPDEEKKGKK